ncbi:hypothetical protein [Methanonatronarchaeum sp. AMET6-2]|uniref:hypothetical protein n=1 Tax=Methanonatronarchaeum sp. AMET6-2 TaxID=2933293 RepID=UPI001FF68D43|nr:hypothetical protein [Methanonatronarchaeum sp. AMET6-2]UOY10293.1 hypothetical protein MU439_01280 [Methanonatronarchaeum sp. AMET6-2]
MDSRIYKNKFKNLLKIYKKNGLKSVFSEILHYIKSNVLDPRSIRAIYIKNINRLQYSKKNLADPYKIIFINPQNIKYMTIPRFTDNLSRYYCYVISGNWDKNILDLTPKEARTECSYKKPCLVKFEDYSLYKSFKKRYKEGEQWKKTKLYKEFMDSNRIDKIQELSKYDYLFKKIKENGYKTQTELRKKFKENKDIPFFRNDTINEINEIRVNIGRDGQFIFDDGRHRLSIAKILEIKKIPVRIFVRHKKWQKIREEISKAQNISELSKKTKKHINHPDLQDLLKNIKK